MVDIIFHAIFTASKTGKTGLTVTVDVDKIARATGARTAVATAAAAVEGRNGHYIYRLAGVADLTTFDYVACFKTADATVDAQHVHSGWFPYSLAYAEQLALLDAAISSRLASAGYAAAPAAADNAEAVWAWADGRTLTVAAVDEDAQQAGAIACYRDVDNVLTFTGLGSIVDRDKLWFTVKSSLDYPDSMAVLQIEATAGLVYLNGQPATAALGVIVIDDQVSGAITVRWEAEAAANLPVVGSLVYDVKILRTGGEVNRLTFGPASISATATRSIV